LATESPYFFKCLLYNRSLLDMTWYTPKIHEVSVGLEINSYACAEV